VVSARQRADKLDQNHNARPDPTRHRLAIAPHDLASQCSRICSWDAIGDHPEGDDSRAEPPKVVKAAVSGYNQSAGRNAIRFGPSWVCGDAGAEADTEHVDEGEGNPEPGEG